MHAKRVTKYVQGRSQAARRIRCDRISVLIFI